MFQTEVVENIKRHILCSVTFFRKSCHLWDNGEKYFRAGQATDDNMAHVHWCWIHKPLLFHWNNCCTNAP